MSNPGPQACRASPFLTESSPQPQKVIGKPRSQGALKESYAVPISGSRRLKHLLRTQGQEVTGRKQTWVPCTSWKITRCCSDLRPSEQQGESEAEEEEEGEEEEEKEEEGGRRKDGDFRSCLRKPLWIGCEQMVSLLSSFPSLLHLNPLAASSAF